MLTLRQIEVIRAIMIAGTVNGAAQLLNISAPGISRTMKITPKKAPRRDLELPSQKRTFSRYVRDLA